MAARSACRTGIERRVSDHIGSSPPGSSHALGDALVHICKACKTCQSPPWEGTTTPECRRLHPIPSHAAHGMRHVSSKLPEDGADSLARRISGMSDVGTRAAGSVPSVRRETEHKLLREAGGQPFHMKVSPCCPSLGQQAVGRARACCILWDAVMQCRLTPSQSDPVAVPASPPRLTPAIT